MCQQVEDNSVEAVKDMRKEATTARCKIVSRIQHCSTGRANSVMRWPMWLNISFVGNPSVSDGGTTFQPRDWNDYTSQLPSRTEPYQ